MWRSLLAQVVHTPADSSSTVSLAHSPSGGSRTAAHSLFHSDGAAVYTPPPDLCLVKSSLAHCSFERVGRVLRATRKCLPCLLSLNATCLSLESLRSFWTVSFGIQNTISVSSMICSVLACIFSPVCCCCTLPAGPRSFARWPASHRSQGYMTCLSITKQATFDYGSTIIKQCCSSSD